jgi:HlyD family secretion protein
MIIRSTMTMSRRKTASMTALAAFGLSVVVAAAQPIVQETTGRKTDDKSKSWQAVAPGRVEPRSGEIRLWATVMGRIGEVPVSANDKVLAGEPLVRLDDAEARARVAAAQAQAATRKRVRNDKSAGKAASRRKAEDAVADAEAALVAARDAFDKTALALRAGSGSDTDIATARAAWTGAQESLDQHRAQLRKLESETGTPLPTESEGQFNVARSELWRAMVELEKLTIRAPIAGTVLLVGAKPGELATPASPQPLLTLGDLSALRVRAELDEHDVGKVKPGDTVVVHADAFRGRQFAGKVSAIAPIVQPGHNNPSGSRNLTDFSVTEVLVDLADPGPLVVGMKVDVYFEPDRTAQ